MDDPLACEFQITYRRHRRENHRVVSYWARRCLRLLERDGLEPIRPPELWISDNVGTDFVMNKERIGLRVLAGRT